MLARLHLDSRSDGVSIGVSSLQTQSNPVMAGLGIVSQQGCRASLVVDHQIDVTIVIDVAVSNASPHVVVLEVGSRLARGELEPLAADVLMQQGRLFIRIGMSNLLEVVVDLPVDDETIRPAIVVEIRQSTPSIRPRADCRASYRWSGSPPQIGRCRD